MLRKDFFKEETHAASGDRPPKILSSGLLKGSVTLLKLCRLIDFFIASFDPNDPLVLENSFVPGLYPRIKTGLRANAHLPLRSKKVFCAYVKSI